MIALAARSLRPAASDGRQLARAEVNPSNGMVFCVRDEHLPLRTDGNSFGPIELRLSHGTAAAPKTWVADARNMVQDAVVQVHTPNAVTLAQSLIHSVLSSMHKCAGQGWDRRVRLPVLRQPAFRIAGN